MNEILHKNVSPPFEGGVVGKVDYLIYTEFSFPTGVVDSIELDGNPHGEYHNIEKDKKRDQYLEGLGFSILRIENRLVFQEPEFVKNDIRKAFKRKGPELE
jgi:hypothetical protein